MLTHAVMWLSERGSEISFDYHMARTASRALSMQNYWENARMRQMCKFA